MKKKLMKAASLLLASVLALGSVFMNHLTKIFLTPQPKPSGGGFPLAVAIPDGAGHGS